MMTDRAGARRSVPASLRRRRRDIRAIQQGQTGLACCATIWMRERVNQDEKL